MLGDRGIGGAAEWARAEQAAGRPVPGEASLLVAAYHRATAGNSAEAIALAELACELHPRSYRSAHLLAGLFELAGEIELAREAFEWALELRPDHPWLPAHIERLGG